jgi:CDP-diacylglycerol--serine O-phosphatidyltransferase
VLEGRGLVTTDVHYGPDLRAHFPPLYPLLLAGWWALLGASAWSTLALATLTDAIAAWALADLGKFGWAAAFIYVAGAALRLARFNTQVGSVDNSYFRGLASPAAAALLASLVWSASDLGFTGDDLPGVVSFTAALLTAAAGLLMVSNFRYLSFKKFDLKRRVPFVIILVLVLLIGLVTVDPPRVLLFMAIAYALSGPGQVSWEKLIRRGAG